MLHFVWTVKDKRKILEGSLLERVKELLYECADVNRWIIKALDVQQDHVYLVVTLDVNVSAESVIRRFQLSSKLLCKEFPELAQYCENKNIWSEEYFVATQMAYEESMRDDYLNGTLE